MPILIVDDDNAMRWLLFKQLERLHYAADTAASGKDALQLLEKKHYELVLLDIDMPGMDGYEVMQQMRQREAQLDLPAVPIIAVTANVDREKCLRCGANDYLMKPVEPGTLHDAVRKWLGGQ